MATNYSDASILQNNLQLLDPKTPVSMTTEILPASSVMAAGELLAVLNAEQQKENMMVVGLLAVIILVGVVGNSLVLIVYRPRPGGVTSSSAVLFILAMAGLDLASCLLSVPYEILDLMMPYDNNNVELCKTVRFLTTAISHSRGLMLLCVAFDRYFKICLPLKCYSCRQAKVAVVTVFILGIALAWPQVVLNGQVTIVTHVPHVLGTDCSILRHLSPLYSLLYHVLMYVIFVVCFSAYALLYGRIFYVLWREGWFESSSPSERAKSGLTSAATGSPAAFPPTGHGRLELCRADQNGRRSTASFRRNSQNNLCPGFSICLKDICHSKGPSEVLDSKSLTVGTCGTYETGISMTSRPQKGRPSLKAENKTDWFELNSENVAGKFCSQFSPENRTTNSKSLWSLSVSTEVLGSENYPSYVSCSYVPVASYKEKHPRALYRCRRDHFQANSRIARHERTGLKGKECQKSVIVRRSSSQPCCRVLPAGHLEQGFIKHSNTSVDVPESLNSSGLLQQGSESKAVMSLQKSRARRMVSCPKLNISSCDIIGKIPTVQSDVCRVDFIIRSHSDSDLLANKVAGLLISKPGTESENRISNPEVQCGSFSFGSTSKQTRCSSFCGYQSGHVLCRHTLLDFSSKQFNLCKGPFKGRVFEHVCEVNSFSEISSNCLKCSEDRRSSEINFVKTCPNIDPVLFPETKVSSKKTSPQCCPGKTKGAVKSCRCDECLKFFSNPCHSECLFLTEVVHNVGNIIPRHILNLSRSCDQDGINVIKSVKASSYIRKASREATTASDLGDSIHSKWRIRRHGGKRLRMGKTTLMLAIVTLGTVLVFVPFLTVIVMKTSGGKYRDSTASTGDLVYKICIRSYLINNIINPFAYYYVNTRLRQKVHRILYCIWHCLLRLKCNASHADATHLRLRSDT